MSRDDWLRRLRAWGVRPARSKGQNFLLDASVVARMAESAVIAPDELVVEIGPGLGIVTEELLSRRANVIAIELDDTLVPRLRHQYCANDRFRLVHANAATVDIGAVTKGIPYKVVANLPYGIATLIVRHLLEASHPPTQLIVMLQKEVAGRMAAEAGDISLLTLATQIYAVPKVLFDVPNDAFYPPPKVTSSVIQLNVRPERLLDATQRDRLFAFATIAFQQRRKTLLNSLSRSLEPDREQIANELCRLGIEPSMRPQAVSLESWLTMATSTVLMNQ